MEIKEINRNLFKKLPEYSKIPVDIFNEEVNAEKVTEVQMSFMRRELYNKIIVKVNRSLELRVANVEVVAATENQN